MDLGVSREPRFLLEPHATGTTENHRPQIMEAERGGTAEGYLIMIRESARHIA